MQKLGLVGICFMWAGMLAAQENLPLNQADFIAAVKQYRPSILQRAEEDPAYRQIVDTVSAQYSRPRTPENQYELIALVKNFDNSLRLKQVCQHYGQQLVLQKMTGVALPSLEEQTRGQLTEIAQDLFQVTLEVRQEQLKDYQKALKILKKNKTLSLEEKDQSQIYLKKQIQSLKALVKQLKRNRRKIIQEAAAWQFSRIQTPAAI